MTMLLHIFAIIGTLVFAMTGAFMASEAGLNNFAILALAELTANGGGTLRDLLLQSHPIFWQTAPHYLWLAASVALLVAILDSTPKITNTAFLWLDALGLAAFTILGAHQALLLQCPPVMAVGMGVITGVAGGIIRDLCCGKVPTALQHDHCAVAALFGASVYVSFHWLFGPTITGQACAFVGILILQLNPTRSFSKAEAPQ